MRKKKRDAHIPFRMNALFFIVFLLFITLVLRLGYIQIVYGENYRAEVEKIKNTVVNTSVPRGKIYDRHHRVIVDNIPLKTIAYTRLTGATEEERMEVAAKLAKYIEKDTVKVTERQLKEYWVTKYPEEAENKIYQSERRQAESGKLTAQDIHRLQLERVTAEDLRRITPAEKEVVAIKQELDSGYPMTKQNIKAGFDGKTLSDEVSNEEYAVVSEHLSELPGVDTATYWERYYPYGGTLQTLLGKISSARDGLPREELEYFLARDYSFNERVGTSYLEAQYEDVLSGQKAKIKQIADKSGHLIGTDIISEGQRGNDLVLTIDIALQTKVEKIVEEELRKTRERGEAPLLDRGFVVMMNPRTGEILAMVGKQYTKNEKGKVEIQDFALGNMTTSYAMGSVVKGATILAGLDSGAIRPGTVLKDEPLKFKATPVKKSYVNMGNINIYTALKRSSNVYMFKTVMTMAGERYEPNGTLNIKSENFDRLRAYYNQFGLGVKTGIDLPNEMTGYKGASYKPGFLLDLAIGQYDTYTPLQLVQYVSTIANGGYRIKPQLVREIRAPSLNENEPANILYSFEPKLLNRVTMKEKHIKIVQEGFRRVTQDKGGTGYKYFSSSPYDPAGKTGTAQAFYDGPNHKRGERLRETINATFIGYAPYRNPEIAFAVVTPWDDSPDHPMSKQVGRKALDAYFELKRQETGENFAGGIR